MRESIRRCDARVLCGKLWKVARMYWESFWKTLSQYSHNLARP